MGMEYDRDSFGTLGRELQRKLESDNDAKVIIVGANAGTGLGKTTLAMHLCRFVDNDWDPQDTGAYWDVDAYEHDYNNREIPSGSAVLLDEIEVMADSRRAMSNRNLKLSQAWARLRNRNVLNIVTAPSMYMVDNRLEILADYWILVEKRGMAKPHYININDFKPNRIQKQEFEGEERIFWDRIPSGDEDYRYIERMKTEMKSQSDTIKLKEHEKQKKKAVRKAEKRYRNEVMKRLYESTEMSQNDLADLFEVTQPTVSEIVTSD